MTRLANSPRRESYPIAHPYYTAWLYSVSLDGYNTGELADSPIYTSSRSPTSEVNRTTGAVLPAGSMVLGTDGIAYVANTSGAPKALGFSGIAQSWTGLQTFNTGIATDTIAEKTAATGVTIDGLLVKDGDLLFADNDKIQIGTGADIVFAWDATRLNVTQATPNSEIRWGVDGAGLDQTFYGDTASAYAQWDQSADCFLIAGAALQSFRGGGAGAGSAGVTVRHVGATLAEGMEERVWEGTVAPAAIETALLTLPANSVVDSVQANVQTALTGGGTTVTYGIGITGDVDAYGTAFSAGAPADLLTQNAKINAIGTRVAAGAGIGVYNAATVALKLIGAATGGTAAGDTALTVGTVRVVVRYRVLVSLANA